MSLQLWGYFAVLILALGILLVKHYWPSYKDDNAVEEVAEGIIKDTTGIDGDLTPDSPETKVESSAQK